MAFANPVSNIIVQSGTDTSLAGLSGVTGVTVTTIGTLIIYDLGTSGLAIDGTLTINSDDVSDREMLVAGQAGATQAFTDVDIRSGGVLNVGHRSIQGAVQYSSEQNFPSIYEKASIDFGEGNGKAFAAGIGDNNGKPFLAVQRAGTLNWYGCINCCGGIGFDGISNTLSNVGNGDAIVNILDGIWDARRTTERSGVGDQFMYTYTNAFTLDGFTVLSPEIATIGSALIVLFQPLLFKNYKPVMTELAFTGSTSSPNDLQFIIEDYPGIIGNTGIDMTSATNNIVNTTTITFLNSGKGSTLDFNTQDPGASQLRAEQNIFGFVVDSLAADRDNCVVATEDKNNLIYQDNVVAGMFDLGNILMTRWTPPGGTTAPLAEHFNPSNTDDDLWDVYTYSFLGLGRDRKQTLLREIGGKLIEFIDPTDLKMVGKVYSTVNALSSISTLDEMYQMSKLFKVENVEIPSLPIPVVTPAGGTADYGDLNIDIDGLAASAYNCTPTILTINPSTIAKVNRGAFTTSIVTVEAQEITIDVPSNTNGDLLVLIVGSSESGLSTYNIPAGWIQLYSEIAVGGTPTTVPAFDVYVRLADNEPASYLITTSTTYDTGHIAQMIVYDTVDNTDISAIVKANATGASGNPNAPSVVAGAKDMVLTIALADAGNQTRVSSPTGYNLIADTPTTGGA